MPLDSRPPSDLPNAPGQDAGARSTPGPALSLSKGLVPALGLFSTTMLVAGGVIGSGIFRKPGVMAAQLGSPGVLLGVWLVAGIVTLLGALSVAELAAAIPRTGGTYVYFERLYGPFAAFLYGWACFVVIQTGSITAVCYVFAEYATQLVPFPAFLDLGTTVRIHLPFIGDIVPLHELGVKLVAATVIGGLTLVNYLGVRFGGLLQNVVTVAKVGGMLGLVLLVWLPPSGGDVRNLIDASADSQPTGWGWWAACAAALQGAFWAYDGWNKVTYVAGELKEPQRHLPRGLIWGVGLVTLLYLLINVAYAYVLSIDEMAQSKLVAADVAQRCLPQGGRWIALAVMLSTFGAANAIILTSARVYFTMAQQGVFPSGLGRVQSQFRSPGNALLVQGLWGIALLFSGTFDMLTDTLIFVSWIFYAAAAWGVILLRRREPDLPRPYRVPGYPWVPAAFIGFALLYLGLTLRNDIVAYYAATATGRPALINSAFGLALVLAGTPIYWFYRRRRQPQRGRGHPPLPLLLLVCLLPGGLAAAEGRPGRVLILGDSISIGYTSQVRELLSDVADVLRPTNSNGHFENCEGTTKGVKETSRWLKFDGGRWDVIHFNFGLHDLKRVNPRTRENSTQWAHPRQAEPDEYESQFAEILRALKATGAKLIFATTTPVPAGPVQPLRDPADVERYNAIARKLAEAQGVIINDLYGLAKTRQADWQRPVNVHFNDLGNQALAFQVAGVIRTALAQALGPQLQAHGPPARLVPTFLLSLRDPALEVRLWAASPLLRHPTNLDFDQDGRVWVAEGVNSHSDRQPEGDRIVVLEDTNHDGRADRSSVFVQEPMLRRPLGLAVIDNQVVISMAPDLLVYTDVNRNRKFDADIDRREVLLTGFNGPRHPHSLHSVTVGPDGLWYWNAGDCGAVFTDRSGRTFRIGSAYDPRHGLQSASKLGWDPRTVAGQRSDDGHVWIGGFAARMRPDGSGVGIIGHNFCNSYEQAVTSFGDIFQSDNADPPAGRAAFLMEYGNAGCYSFDGRRAWPADRRPGQREEIAQWRQEDPGTLPAGDVYGQGAPTGIAFVEESALGPKYRGLLLSCDSVRNTVFGYFPKPQGAGFNLERFVFLTSNPQREVARAEFRGGAGSMAEELKSFFHPNDVAVGPDGAIYVSDFSGSGTGEHQAQDGSLSGAIYRIAPKEFAPTLPKVDLSRSDGAVAALRNPAINVRGAARNALLKHSPKANVVARLLKDESPFVRARAVWVLSELGPDGRDRVQRLLKDRDAQQRVVAFRALRRALEATGEVSGLVALARQAATDSSAAVRREAALAMRNLSWEQSRETLVLLAGSYDASDIWYLEALGTGAQGKESELYEALLPSLGQADPLAWSARWAWLTWRLHPPQSAIGFRQRALATTLPERHRRAALTALAYIGTQEAVQGIVAAAAQGPGPIKAEAFWWLLNRKDTWKSYALDAELKRRGIGDLGTPALSHPPAAPAADP